MAIATLRRADTYGFAVAAATPFAGIARAIALIRSKHLLKKQKANLQAPSGCNKEEAPSFRIRPSLKLVFDFLKPDFVCEADVKALVWLLSESVSQRLRESHLRCRTISVGIRRAVDLTGRSRQTTLRVPTCLTTDVANIAMELIRASQPLDEEHSIRAIHVRTTNLSSMLEPTQHDLFGDVEKVSKLEKLDLVIDKLRRRFGNKCVHRAVELTDEVMSGLDIKRDNTVHPVGFLR